MEKGAGCKTTTTLRIFIINSTEFVIIGKIELTVRCMNSIHTFYHSMGIPCRFEIPGQLYIW